MPNLVLVSPTERFFTYPLRYLNKETNKKEQNSRIVFYIVYSFLSIFAYGREHCTIFTYGRP